jgi:hypothetical protein
MLLSLLEISRTKNPAAIRNPIPNLLPNRDKGKEIPGSATTARLLVVEKIIIVVNLEVRRLNTVCSQIVHALHPRQGEKLGETQDMWVWSGAFEFLNPGKFLQRGAKVNHYARDIEFEKLVEMAEDS